MWRTTGTSHLFIAQAQYRDGLFSMMGHRRSTKRAEMFWYRDVEGTVMFMASKPLPGVKEPRYWRAVTAQAATEELKQVLWVPGHQHHEFSPGWTPQPDSSGATGGQATFDTSGLSDQDLVTVMALFGEEAKTRFDVDVVTGDFPDSACSGLEMLMEDVIAEVRAAKDGG